MFWQWWLWCPLSLKCTVFPRLVTEGRRDAFATSFSLRWFNQSFLSGRTCRCQKLQTGTKEKSTNEGGFFFSGNKPNQYWVRWKEDSLIYRNVKPRDRSGMVWSRWSNDIIVILSPCLSDAFSSAWLYLRIGSTREGRNGPHEPHSSCSNPTSQREQLLPPGVPTLTLIGP